MEIVLDDWIKAGKIAGEIREWSKTQVKPGTRVLDLAEAVEKKILDKGAMLAFPVNISSNAVAAHDTAQWNDVRVLQDEIVKVDIGVAYNGAIGDTACTIDLSGKYHALVEAAEAALAAAAKRVAIGTSLGELGKIIEDTIVKRGFQPIRNLSGHGLSPWQVHVPPTVPNYNNNDPTPLKKGQIIAIEPFATTGIGKIKDHGQALIYEEMLEKPIRDQTARQLLQKIKIFEGLPFATRQITSKELTPAKIALGLRSLQLNGNLRPHPPLIEISNGLVSQAEHTFYVDDEVIVLTK